MTIFEVKLSSATTLQDLLGENEYVKDNYKNCDILVLDYEGKEKLGFLNRDILLTDYRLIFLKDAEYSTQNSKIPSKFSCGDYINISSIIVNAVSSCEKAEDNPYLYVQLGDPEFNEDSDEDLESSHRFSEINIRCSDQNTIYTLFNSISETAAYMEQLENLSDLKSDDELTTDQE
ncbi:hypothetical protein [Cryptosporidium parvum Iowa II]|uniref:Uncharacterized protein n=2 Tax=Cryptosporidium parvum TaxID=5807 RepID=Q5CTH3_CRYPI|nr:hypothetical protein [Cryptosporidium parvum Iowa II]EAK88712.1 hypothetical protein cgd2_3020 [Cryptosporidium parvum Iowa II]QOY42928.1 PH domain-like protein [Cryptosporidium parvum]WKS76600.1 hypothetical protein CPCDC_2g3020 [Cryptosporidium sp. 43IA8]WRK31093.1 PH domain-like protein [Cryptosporidium parvum]|eukprot:QOY42928.1 hypothetical protein CPATCC_000617 [Cryptosporidium parvum]